MKNIFKILLFIVSAALVYSCQERDADPRVELNAITNAKFVTPPTGTYTVTASNLNNVFFTFKLDKASYGTDIQLNYQLQISKDGMNFTPLTNLGDISSSVNIAVTYQQLNTALAELNLAAGETHNVEVRIKATALNSIISPSYSSSVKFSVIPYEPNYDLMYASIAVPGNYGGASGYADWSPDNSPRLYSAGNDDKYAGFVWVNSATPEFKFTYGTQGWANNKGDTANPNTYATLRDSGENVRGQFSNATYFIRVNWTANTYSVARADMGIIGEATPNGWSSDTKLTFNTSTKKFELASIALQGGKIFKFRNNPNWDIKIQPKNTDVTLVSGKAVQVFNNAEGTVSGDPSFICPTTGNYKVELDLHNSGRYTLKITKL